MKRPKDYSKINEKFSKRVAHMLKKHRNVALFSAEISYPDGYPQNINNEISVSFLDH